MLVGGFLSDAWLARGMPAARLRVALVGLGLATVPAVLWPLVPSAAGAYSLLALMVLGIALAQSAVPTAVQAVFPNRLRGQAIALYLLLSGLLGIGLGPTAVALVTDRLFHDDNALGQAIAMSLGPCAVLGLWLIASGLRPYERTHAVLNPGAPAPTAVGA
jgi:MFS family permease